VLRVRLPVMPSEVRILDVLIASPGDTQAERDTVERALHEWNDHRADAEGLILRPRRYEIASVPVSGQGDAQAVINRQLVDRCQIVIGIFYSRLGTPTPRAASGTAEEISRAINKGKKVHLYFARKRLPPDVDLTQLQALRDFKSRMDSEGLVATFKSESQLAKLVARAIEYDVKSLKSGSAGHVASEEPVYLPDIGYLPWSHDYSSPLRVMYARAGPRDMEYGVANFFPERIIIGSGDDRAIFLKCSLLRTSRFESEVWDHLIGPSSIPPHGVAEFKSSFKSPLPSGPHLLAVIWNLESQRTASVTTLIVEITPQEL
jgi:hypothetical protein